MAVPANASPRDTSGRYVMNRALSTPHDDVLAAQGVSWLQRTGISIATVTLELKHTVNQADKTETITFQHTATGGIKGTSGVYHVPSTDHVHSDHVFGAVSINAERKPLASIAHPFLVQGWTADVQDTPFPDVKGVLWTLTVPDKTKRADEWVAEQVWGYADHDIPGKGTEKRYTRRIHFESPALTKDVLLVYDLKDGGMTSGSGTTTSTDEEEEDLGSFGGS